MSSFFDSSCRVILIPIIEFVSHLHLAGAISDEIHGIFLRLHISLILVAKDDLGSLKNSIHSLHYRVDDFLVVRFIVILQQV